MIGHKQQSAYLDRPRTKGEDETAHAVNCAVDEAALMLAAREDRNRFAPLYERYFDPIYAYCLKRVGTPQDAEDLTSLTFTQALRDLDQYRGGSVAAWLFRIARHRVMDHYRRRREQVPLETVAFQIADATPTPLDTVIQAEDSQLIRELVAELPEYQREILALKLNGALSADEIGAVVGKKAGTVRVMLHRIVKRLRTRYEGSMQKEGAS